jgi:hypothetical protein
MRQMEIRRRSGGKYGVPSVSGRHFMSSGLFRAGIRAGHLDISGLLYRSSIHIFLVLFCNILDRLLNGPGRAGFKGFKS